MRYHDHSKLVGKHATFAPSSPYWLNDDEDQMTRRICGKYATSVGTLLHDIARRHIQFGYKLIRGEKRSVLLELLDNGIPQFVISNLDFDLVFENLMNYINDAIGFRMDPEVVLAYSDDFFGTCDAISYDEKSKFLRIHDLKTGSTPAHMEQLEIYAALFSLEYEVPKDIELRIYQGNEVVAVNPEISLIKDRANVIVAGDKFITDLRG